MYNENKKYIKNYISSLTNKEIIESIQDKLNCIICYSNRITTGNFPHTKVQLSSYVYFLQYYFEELETKTNKNFSNIILDLRNEFKDIQKMNNYNFPYFRDIFIFKIKSIKKEIKKIKF